MLAHVASLFVFPVKACAGLAVDRLVFTDAGRVEGDREWAITSAAGQVTWQGEHPLLALVRPAFDGTALVLQAPGAAMLHVPRGQAGQDAGPVASAFLRAVTGADLRLVRLDEAALARSIVNPVHLLSQASLDELNQTLRSRGLAVAEMQRFRPNIVLEGDALVPFLEEHLAQLTWGERGELRATSPCVRCIVPNVNPATGEVNVEPAPTVAELSAQRRPGTPSALGIYASPTRAAVLTQGATVQLELSL
jgi:uncharacterized protein